MEKIIASAIIALIGVMIWYLKYQTKRQATREDKQDEERIKRQEKLDKEQKEDREYFRNLLTNDVKDLHKDNLKNAELNRKSITLQKSIAKKTIGALDIICDRLNGNNPKIVKAKKELKVKVNKTNE